MTRVDALRPGSSASPASSPGCMTSFGPGPHPRTRLRETRGAALRRRLVTVHPEAGLDGSVPPRRVTHACHHQPSEAASLRISPARRSSTTGSRRPRPTRGASRMRPVAGRQPELRRRPYRRGRRCEARRSRVAQDRCSRHALESRTPRGTLGAAGVIAWQRSPVRRVCVGTTETRLRHTRLPVVTCVLTPRAQRWCGSPEPRRHQ
jgi:hypothetical protein